jgi:hypothetical protein
VRSRLSGGGRVVSGDQVENPIHTLEIQIVLS